MNMVNRLSCSNIIKHIIACLDPQSCLGIEIRVESMLFSLWELLPRNNYTHITPHGWIQQTKPKDIWGGKWFFDVQITHLKHNQGVIYNCCPKIIQGSVSIFNYSVRLLRGR